MPSVVAYRGPSMLDGKPIVVVASFADDVRKANEKTGRMVQTWILRADVLPTEAAHAGTDASVCGPCPLRGKVLPTASGSTRNFGRSCYVVLHHVPNAKWRWAKDRPVNLAAAAAMCVGRNVRLGSYGDPAAVPVAVLHKLLRGAKGWTGYTHQWRTHAHLSGLCMASCDTDADREEARASGWRTFTVGGVLGEGELFCPATPEGGSLTTCDTCRLCSGTTSGAKDVRVLPHGSSRNHHPNADPAERERVRVSARKRFARKYQ